MDRRADGQHRRTGRGGALTAMLDSSRWRRHRVGPAAAQTADLFAPRRSDPPATSRRARAAVVSRGVVGAQAAAVLSALLIYPRSTYRELAFYLLAEGKISDRNAVARRLPELSRLGLVRVAGSRRCEVGGLMSQVWEPVIAATLGAQEAPT